MAFQSHIELLQFFLARRDEIVERIQGLLNAQRKPIDYLQDAPLLSRHFEDCFFIGATSDQARLRGLLEEAHWAGGFKPKEIAGLQNGLAGPAEMMVRGFHLWQLTRWPGRNGRIHYAHTLFNLYVIRCLTLLSMRLWDDGPGPASGRLSQIQGSLDELWRIKTANQPVLVRDARWLIPMAQSPATEDLAPYFDVAERIAGSFSDEDRLAIHSASVRMAAGHLRSQIRYYAINKGVSIDDTSLVLLTRNSNALDFALLIQDLVPLLEAYEQACRMDDRRQRLALADVICQGVSPDPELFLHRLELLGAYSMIEHLFVALDGDGHAAYTPAGRRHVQLLQRYTALIARVSKALSDDCQRFRPAAGTYSPYGVLYGFASDLFGHMALKTLQPDALSRFSLEDVFAGEDGGTDKLAWVSGWRALPHLTREVQKLFEYPQQFAEQMFARLEDALRRRASDHETNTSVQAGRLFLVTADTLQSDSAAPEVSDLPIRYIRSSDRQLVAERKAQPYHEVHLLGERREGKYMVSYQTAGGWVGLTKDILTDVLGAGRDVRVTDLPAAAVAVLTLMCPTLVVTDREHPIVYG